MSIFVNQPYIDRQRRRMKKLQERGVKVPLPVSEERIKRRVQQLNKQLRGNKPPPGTRVY